MQSPDSSKKPSTDNSDEVLLYINHSKPIDIPMAEQTNKQPRSTSNPADSNMNKPIEAFNDREYQQNQSPEKPIPKNDRQIPKANEQKFNFTDWWSTKKNKKPEKPIMYTDSSVADQVIIEQKTNHYKKKLLRIGLIMLGVLVIAAIVFVSIKLLSGTGNEVYAMDSIKHDGYTYNFMFDKYTTTVNVNGFNTLVGYNIPNNTKVAVTAYPALQNENCNTEYSGIIVAFMTVIRQDSFPVCASLSRNIILSNFKYNGVWQTIFIYAANSKARIDYKTARTIVGTISIT